MVMILLTTPQNCEIVATYWYSLSIFSMNVSLKMKIGWYEIMEMVRGEDEMKLKKYYKINNLSTLASIYGN